MEAGKRTAQPCRRSRVIECRKPVFVLNSNSGSGKALFQCFLRLYPERLPDRSPAKNVREKDFDIDNFLNTLEPYYRDGEYGYLLNSDQELDLLHKRFVVFELDNIRDHKILLTVTTLIIIEMFINKNAAA